MCSHCGRDHMVVGFITTLCNQCLSPLALWVWNLLGRGVLDTRLCDKVCQWLALGQWFSSGTMVSSTNKTDCHVITEILLKVALNTITQISNPKDCITLKFTIVIIKYNICVIAVFSLYLQQKAEREKSRAKVIAARPKPAIGRRTGPAINSKPKWSATTVHKPVCDIQGCYHSKTKLQYYFVLWSFIYNIYRVPTHPGKRKIPWNFVLHVPGREMSLKIKKMIKMWDLPWKSLLKA